MGHNTSGANAKAPIRSKTRPHEVRPAQERLGGHQFSLNQRVITETDQHGMKAVLKPADEYVEGITIVADRLIVSILLDPRAKQFQRPRQLLVPPSVEQRPHYWVFLQ